jgi:hypothetical protein
MFTKSKLSFKNELIFGKKFKPTADKAFCVVAKMLFFGRINVDGSINLDQAGFLKKGDIWSYIYYLYVYNNTTVEEFVMMRNEKGKASALNMYTVVKDTVGITFPSGEEIQPFDINALIHFINVIVRKDIQNPVVDYLKKIMGNDRAVDAINRFNVETGSSKVVAVTDPKDADIKIRFGTL